MALILVLGRQQQVDFYEFQSGLVSILSFRQGYTGRKNVVCCCYCFCLLKENVVIILKEKTVKNLWK